MKLAIFFLLSVSAALALINPAPITLVAISTPFNSPVGIDYHAPSNTLIQSVNYNSGGYPYNFERILLDGTHSQFTNVFGLNDEVKIATVRPGNPQFPSGDLFTGNGINGEVQRLSGDGLTVTNPWLTLPSYVGLMRGSLYVDQTGVWGGDLLIVTTEGYVYRANAAAVATYVGYAGTHLEGVVTIPNDASVWGDLAGKVVAGDENNRQLWAWDTDGNRRVWSVFAAIEDLDFTFTGQNFFGNNFGTNLLLGATGAQFPANALVATQEFPDGGVYASGLFILQWDFGCNCPVTTPIPLSSESFFPGQWEHTTFAPTGVVEIPPSNDCDDKTDFFGTLPSTYNTFTLGDFTCYNSDTQGRIAAGGNMDIRNYAVASSLFGSGFTKCADISGNKNSVVAGGSFFSRSCSVRAGNVVHGTTNNVDNTVTLASDCGYVQDTPINFADAATKLNAVSQQVEGLAATGSVSFVDNWLLKLVGTNNANVEVFDVVGFGSGSQFHGYSVENCHADASIFINFGGSSINLGDGAFFGQFSALKTHIVWNFFEATSFSFNGNQIQGSILAPGAAVGPNNGAIDGQLFAKSLNAPHSCPEQHQFPFVGCIPADTPTK